MELINFRVSMFKGIVDSGWVEVEPLTVFVGKNESGKTSLLKALHKLNPYNTESYEIAKEWPRGRRRERNEEHVVCQARFQLSKQERSKLAQITDRKTFPDIVEVSRNYVGDVKINFEGEVFSDKPHPDDVDNILDTLPEPLDECGEEFKQCVNECIEEVKRLAYEGRFTELAELAERHEESLGEVLSPSDPPQQSESVFVNNFVQALSNLEAEFEELPTTFSKIYEYIINCLPTFVYMDDYRTFNGTAYLNDIKTRWEEDRSTEEDETFLTILNLSGLDLDDLVDLAEGDEEQIEERQLDLADGASTLTQTISDRFRQRRYEVDYRVDGQSFFTYVKDDQDPSLIRLEERSKGFQWFFSFELMFMHETEGTFKGCVILLDEPGLHLHPDAQRDLLRRLEHYAAGNKLLYTTHLPFMIDLNHPDRIRILNETKNGIVVTTDLTKSSPEARLVLQAALGMDASQSFLVADRNLVVEGVDDYLVLTALSNLLERNGIDSLPEDVRITPGASASEAVHVVTFMIGQNLDVVALFDSDKAGRDAKDKLVKKWLTGYKKGTHTDAILFGDAVGASDGFALEDLFSEDFYLESVKKTYPGVNGIEFQGEDLLWNKVERALKKGGIKRPNKGAIAKRLRKRLSQMKDLSELPKETQERTAKLFHEIRKAFGEDS